MTGSVGVTDAGIAALLLVCSEAEKEIDDDDHDDRTEQRRHSQQPSPLCSSLRFAKLRSTNVRVSGVRLLFQLASMLEGACVCVCVLFV